MHADAAAVAVGAAKAGLPSRAERRRRPDVDGQSFRENERGRQSRQPQSQNRDAATRPTLITPRAITVDDDSAARQTAQIVKLLGCETAASYCGSCVTLDGGVLFTYSAFDLFRAVEGTAKFRTKLLRASLKAGSTRGNRSLRIGYDAGCWEIFAKHCFRCCAWRPNTR
jgi:hypothetical protein